MSGEQQGQQMMMVDQRGMPVQNYDPSNPVIYYVIPSGNGQNSMMMFNVVDGQMVPAQQHPHGSSTSPDGASHAQGIAIQGQPGTMLPPNIVITQSEQGNQAMNITYVPAGSMPQQIAAQSGDNSVKHDSQAGGPFTPRARRIDVPNCTACGAVGKQVGRSGSRIKEECCLCANCEDRAKRYKKDGLRKAVQCGQTSELFHPGMVPVCPIKHLRKHCPQASCEMCRTSDNDNCCRACQLAKIMHCIDFERFYTRKYKKKSNEAATPMQAMQVMQGQMMAASMNGMNGSMNGGMNGGMVVGNGMVNNGMVNNGMVGNGMVNNGMAQNQMTSTIPTSPSQQSLQGPQ